MIAICGGINLTTKFIGNYDGIKSYLHHHQDHLERPQHAR